MVGSVQGPGRLKLYSRTLCGIISQLLYEPLQHEDGVVLHVGRAERRKGAAGTTALHCDLSRALVGKRSSEESVAWILMIWPDMPFEEYCSLNVPCRSDGL